MTPPPNASSEDHRPLKSDQPKPFDASDPKISRRRAVQKFIGYTAPAVIALLVARDAAASPA